MNSREKKLFLTVASKDDGDEPDPPPETCDMPECSNPTRYRVEYSDPDETRWMCGSCASFNAPGSPDSVHHV